MSMQKDLLVFLTLGMRAELVQISNYDYLSQSISEIVMLRLTVQQIS